MPAAATAENEPERLAALLALQILDSAASPEFDVFPILASKIFKTPAAAISLIDRERQWFKARVGLDLVETPRAQALCDHAILDPDRVLYVPDATLDPRFADNPLVTGDFRLRFYACMPIAGPSGHPVGALCVLDHVPREASEADLDQLRLLAVAVGSALRLHAAALSAQRQADSDPVTGLLNRAGFDRHARDALAHPADGHRMVGVLFLDLDSFGTINELFGHAGGDAALREVARRLRATIPPADLVSRFGGDEFCVLVPDIAGAAELQSLAALIHAALVPPILIETQSVRLGTSIGIAIGTRHADNCDQLVREADIALTHAKQAGRGTTRMAAAHRSSTRPRRVGRIGLHDSLRQALGSPGQEPFAVALQPIQSAPTGAVTGYEALARWPLPGGQVRLPDEFIPAAEATGQIVQLDRLILDQACRLAAGWPGHLRVSSNLSAANFFAGNLVATVRDTLARHGLAPDRLQLEITETALLHDRARIRAVIVALKTIGVRMILDDFGAGHASLAYLRDYPFDGLKIDRSFTAGLDQDTTSRPLVHAIIAMSRALGLETTAEGVETPRQLAILREEGVDNVQGYLLGRPRLAR